MLLSDHHDHEKVWWYVHSFRYNLAKCPPCSRIQAQTRGCHCLIASSMNTWWECSHCSIRCDFCWSTSWIRLRYTRSCSFPQIWLAGKFCDECFAPYPFSCLSILIKTRSSAENTMFIVYANCLRWLCQHNAKSGCCVAHVGCPMQCFHYFCRPAWHSSNVPCCKPYAVWNIRSILPSFCPPPPPVSLQGIRSMTLWESNGDCSVKRDRYRNLGNRSTLSEYNSV